MRYVELWYELKEEAIPVLQGAIRAAFPNQQLRWVKGQAYTLLTFGMVCQHFIVITVRYVTVFLNHSSD